MPLIKTIGLDDCVLANVRLFSNRTKHFVQKTIFSSCEGLMLATREAVIAGPI